MMTPRLVLVLASLLAAGVQSGVVPRNLVGTPTVKLSWAHATTVATITGQSCHGVSHYH